MSITKYQVFLSTVELGSLTKTAEVLNLTQSGVSHAIASLEAEFGFLLLIRDRAGIRLTSNGERLLRYVRDILQANERLKQEVAAVNGLETGTVRIGSFVSVSTQWLPPILQEFQRQHPSIELKLLEGDYDDIDRWIANGSVDFGFISAPSSKAFEVMPLNRDRMLCILPLGHPLGEKPFITFSDIKNEPFIMPAWGKDDDVRRLLQKNKIVPKVKFEVAEDRTIIAMVQNGLGISILPEMVLFRLSDGLHTLELEKPHFRTIGIAAPSLSTMSPAAKKVIACVRTWLETQALLEY